MGWRLKSKKARRLFAGTACLCFVFAGTVCLYSVFAKAVCLDSVFMGGNCLCSAVAETACGSLAFGGAPAAADVPAVADASAELPDRLRMLQGKTTGTYPSAYEVHSQEEETLPLAEGTSYYEYQWALKNSGNMQRIAPADSGLATRRNRVEISCERSDSGIRLGTEEKIPTGPSETFGSGKAAPKTSGTSGSGKAAQGPSGPFGNRKAVPGSSGSSGSGEAAQRSSGSSESGKAVQRSSGTSSSREAASGLSRTTSSTENPDTARSRVTDSVAGVDIEIERAWEVYRQGPDRRQVVVAMIDTGVDISHPKLRDSIWVNSGEIPGDGIDNDHNGYVDDINGWNFYSGSPQVYAGKEDDHGTHGAGTIAAAWDKQGTLGIADSAWVKVMVLKVLGSREGKGISSGVKEAIRYAQDNGAQICNLSMGTLTYDGELEQIIRDSPMLFVVSSGNGDAVGAGYDIDDLPMYPACFTAENIIAVANLMFDGTLDESSNYGAVSVDLAAPGTHILNAVPDGYAFMSGTSMAAPMVTGTAALVYSCRTDLDMIGVKEAILKSARPMEGLRGKVAVGGMLNAYGAITYRSSQ